MNIDYVALLPFAIITIFTPGPNNIIAAAMGIRYGYRRTLPLLLGIWTGFYLVFLLCLAVATALLAAVAQFEQIISIIGAFYILWLAYHTFTATYTISEDQKKPLSFISGLVLQLINPKVLIFGLTVFSTFLSDMPRTVTTYSVVPALFASVSFMSTSTWTLAGSIIASSMHNPKTLRIINTILAAVLLLIAIDLSGLWNLF